MANNQAKSGVVDKDIEFIGVTPSDSTTKQKPQPALQISSPKQIQQTPLQLPKTIATQPKVVHITKPTQPQQKKKMQTLIATKTPAKSDSDNVVDDEGRKIERRCENPDCSAPTLISLVPTKPTPQFVQNPHVISEPILVNGYTSVFQINGEPAKMSQVKGTTPDGKIRYQTNSPIYRVVPNTHAHIVNYVIVDAEGDTLNKIKNNDPATMKRLLDSQTNSANQLLKKLMGLKKVEGKIIEPSKVLNSPKKPPAPPAIPTTPFVMPPASTISTQPIMQTVQTAMPTVLTVSQVPVAPPNVPSQAVPIKMPLQSHQIQQIQATSTPIKVVPSVHPPAPVLLPPTSPLVATSPLVGSQMSNTVQNLVPMHPAVPITQVRSAAPLQQTASLASTAVNARIASTAAPIADATATTTTIGEGEVAM